MIIKLRTLTEEQIDNIIEDLAAKYIELTEIAVENKECPPNIYKFVADNFRKLKGHDTEWYDVFNGFKNKLYQLKKWNTQWRRMSPNSESIWDYQYCYKEELKWVKPIPPIEMDKNGNITDERVIKFMHMNLSPYESSQFI